MMKNTQASAPEQRTWQQRATMLCIGALLIVTACSGCKGKEWSNGARQHADNLADMVSGITGPDNSAALDVVLLAVLPVETVDGNASRARDRFPIVRTNAHGTHQAVVPAPGCSGKPGTPALHTGPLSHNTAADYNGMPGPALTTTSGAAVDSAQREPIDSSVPFFYRRSVRVAGMGWRMPNQADPLVPIGPG